MTGKKTNQSRPLEELKKAEFVRVGELADLTRLKVSTLRFYTKMGLLAGRQADEKSNRHYPRIETLAKISKILRLKEKRLSIEEIKQELNGK
jgi:DNA-binding transcriptional MerR regulator